MSKFRIGEQVYVKGNTPRFLLGNLHKTFTTVASEVIAIKGDSVMLRLGRYSTTIPQKHVKTYTPKINVQLQRKLWEWQDEQERIAEIERIQNEQAENTGERQ